ncbi:hypothetical protein HMN09_00583900 [Mycena chlorophos]|uniref:LYC1 C-terminal domain-containing protein n=1 Tax=Mycena chlorophos TaxID=658473 RepID=A0A8H6WFD9_MYCCL|nr:hypothetical protein HMN09_00583900 [Mycena chlorophos]
MHMPFDLSTLSIYPATPEQTVEARRRTQHEWGRGLTLEAHLARDAAQEQFPGSLEGRFMTWVLAPRNDPTTLDFKCACETFRRTGSVYDPSIGAVESVGCYGIASVFTPPTNRGQGFASHLMSLLHWVIADERLLPVDSFPVDKWGAPPSPVPGLRNARFSALWTDVGEFYSSCGPYSRGADGWVIRGTSTVVWDVEGISSSSASGSDSSWTWLDEAGTSRLWQEDALAIQQALVDSTDLCFTFLPSDGVAFFQHARLDFFTQRLEDPPTTWGIISAGRKTYATWAIDPRPPTPPGLTVTCIRATAETLPALVGKLFEMARKHSITRIESWGMSPELEDVAKGIGARVFDREEHLPAFKWYGKEPEAGVRWAYNER